MVRPRTLPLAAGGKAQVQWIELLELGEELLEANRGTHLAPELTFPARSSPGATTVVADASGVDGVGGYTFFADAPGHVWLTSEVWQSWAQDALHRAAAGPGVGDGGGEGGGEGRKERGGRQGRGT